MTVELKPRKFSDTLVLDDSEKGVVITGITDDVVAKSSGLQAGDEIVAATIHLDHLNKDEVLTILKALEPYDDNMKVLTKKELGASAGLGSLGLDGMLNLDKSLETSAEAPSVSLNGSSLNADGLLNGGIKAPTINGDLPGLSLSGSDLNTADLKAGLKGPELKADLNTPKATLDVDTPNVKTSGLNFKPPKFSMPSFNLPQISTPDADLNADIAVPDVNADAKASTLTLTADDLAVDAPNIAVNGPKVDVNSPSLNAEVPDLKLDTHHSGINWPHLKWKGKTRVPDASVDVEAPTIDAPKVNASIDGDLNTGSGFSWPHQKWKKPKGLKVDLDADPNLSGPNFDVNLEGPKGDVTLPDAELKTPEVNIDGHSGINWPHKKWKLKTPKADVKADINTPDADVSLPKVSGELNTPKVDVDLPKTDLDAKVDGPKLRFPTLKRNKLKGLDVKTPDANLDVDLPDASLNASSLNAELPRADIDVSAPKIDGDIGIDGDINGPEVKTKWWKKIGTWKKKDIDAELKTPDADLKLPNIDGDVKIDAVDLDADLTTTDVDISGPKVDIDRPKAGLKLPKFKLPKIRSKLQGPDIDGDLDANVDLPKIETEAPNLQLKSPKVEGSFDTPDVDVSLPNADLNAELPEVDAKIKQPKFKLPKFGLSGPRVKADADLPDAKIETQDLDINASKLEVSTPDVDLNGLSVDTPKIEGEAPDVGGKLKIPKIKWPKGVHKTPSLETDANLSVVDLSGPDVSLNTSELNLEGSKIEGDINVSNLSIDAPKVDADVDAPKFKLPKIKWPKGKTSIDGDLEAPDLSLKSSDLNLETLKIDGELDTPDVKINGTDLNVDVPKVDADVDAPKFKLPKIKWPKAKSIDADLEAPDMNLKTSDLKLDGPEIDGKLSTQGLNVEAPTVDIEAADLSIDTPEVKPPAGGVKLPSFKLPKLNFGKSKLDADIKTDVPDLDIKAPKGSVNLPDLSTPDLEANLDTGISAPKVDASLPSVSLPKAEVNAPVFSLPKTSVDTPTLDLKAADIDANLSPPKIDADLDSNVDIKAPKVDTSLGDFNLPHFKMPSLNLSGADVDAPSVDTSLKAGVDVPKVDVNLPSADASVSAPSVDVKAPTIEAKTPEIDASLPSVDANVDKPKLNFKMPKFFTSKPKSPEVDLSADLPKVDGEINTPDVSAPNVSADIDGTTLDLGATGGVEAETKGSRLKWPFKWGQKTNEEEGSGAESDSDLANTEVEVPAFVFHRLPENKRDSFAGIMDTLSHTSREIENRDYVMSKGIRLPFVNSANTTNMGEKIDILERLKLSRDKSPSGSVSPTDSNIDINLGGASAAGSGETGVGGSILGLITSGESENTEEDKKLSLGLSNMLGLNAN